MCVRVCVCGGGGQNERSAFEVLYLPHKKIHTDTHARAHTITIP